MTPSRKRVTVISEEPPLLEAVAEVMGTVTDLVVNRRAGTLADILAQTPNLPTETDLIVFRTSDHSRESDLKAVSTIRTAVDRKVTLFALTDDTISLAEARRLTRTGVDEVLPLPFNPTELRDLAGRWAAPNALVLSGAPTSAATPGRIIAVAQARGGIGTSTLAVNLADRLLDRTGLLRKVARNRVALVDLDLQFGSIASLLDIEPRDSLFMMAASGTVPDAMFLRQSMVEHASGLSVMTAPGRFAPLDALGAPQVAAILDHLRGQFDFVVVDLPHALLNWIEPILERADLMLLVTDSSVPAIRQARKLIDFFTEDHMALNIEIVISLESRPLITSRHHAEAAKVLERPLKYWLPEDPRAARAAADRGVPLSQAAPSSALAKSIGRIGKALLSPRTDKQRDKAKVR